jgi:hypothetical protein
METKAHTAIEPMETKAHTARWKQRHTLQYNLHTLVDGKQRECVCLTSINTWWNKQKPREQAQNSRLSFYGANASFATFSASKEAACIADLEF